VKVLSLFTGAGGLDIGLERAGFEIAGCVEIDQDCRETLRANRQEWRQLAPGDIHAHRPADVLAAADLARGEAALLAGGPPCQPFSKSGQWRDGRPRRMSDPRASTLRAYLDVLEATLPEAMLLENVKGITATRAHVTHRFEAFDVLRSSLQRINKRHGTSYDPIAIELDAADYGVPQHRERVFMFASRDGLEFVKPKPTHAEAATRRDGSATMLAFARAWDAIADLDDPEFDESLQPVGKWAALLPSIPEGSNYLHHTSRGEGEPLFGWRRRYWSFLLKLAKARPSWTLQAQAGPATGPFHWRSRRLMREELLRLQCFPADWTIYGEEASARRQLGNAVPPPIGQVLGSAISQQVLGEARADEPLLIPPARPDCPAPEEPAPVSQQYLGQRGVHADHPGPGRGPGALARIAAATQ
jgi:DNA (cytosine-5)-methyltransferase 1